MIKNKSQKNIPDGWQEVRLKDICTLVMGQSPSSLAYNEIKKGLPLIQGNNDIKKRRTIARIWTRDITKEADFGDVILTVRAPVGLVGIATEKVCIGRGVCSLKFEKEVNKDFTFRFLEYFEKKWKKYEQGSTFTAVNSTDIRNLKLHLPPLPEQKRIVSVLETWDQVIEKLAKKIEIKKNVKKGLMQNLLTGKVRLAGFNGERKTKKLGELYDITSSKRVFQSEWKTEGVPFYRAREIVKLSEKGFVKNELFISQEMYDLYKSKYGVPQINDLLVTGVGTIGKIYRIKENKEIYFKDGNIIWLKNKNCVSSIFIEQLFKTRFIKKQILGSTPITTVATYTINAAKETKVSLPELKEQKAIADILMTADSEIKMLEKKLSIIKDQKKYLLDNLVTGQIRVPENLKN